MKIIVLAFALLGTAAGAQSYQPVPNPLQQQQDRINSGQYGITQPQQQQIMQQPGGGIYNPNITQIPQGGIVPRQCVGVYCFR